MPKELILFIIGYVAAHFQILQKIRSQQVTGWLLLVVFLGFGFGWQFLGSYFLKETMSMELFTKLLPLKIMLDQTFYVFIGLAYCMLIVLLCQTKLGLWLLYPLRFAGRMALTNYLMQSVICVLIFNSYGMGLYGTLTPVTLVIIALCIYLFQLLVSRLYLSYNEQGPMEMLWRRWSYGISWSKRKQAVV
ncbi:MAG: DUF418 domain-containing protein [Anditalea sp.]